MNDDEEIALLEKLDRTLASGFSYITPEVPIDLRGPLHMTLRNASGVVQKLLEAARHNQEAQDDDDGNWTHETVQRWLSEHAKFTREHIAALEEKVSALPVECRHFAILYIIRMRGVAQLIESPLPRHELTAP